jgi:transcription antitermination factor NusG
MLDATPHTRLDADERLEGTPRFAPPLSGCRQGTWHVVASYPKAERRAYAALHLKGYEPYLPLLTVRRPDRSYHTAALFPGYLFIRLDLQRPWYPIRYAPGVYSLLTTDGSPTVCPEAVILALRAGDALRAAPLPATASWAPGMACSLATGPLRHHPAVVTDVGRETATVAILMLGQLCQARVPLDALTQRGNN